MHRLSTFAVTALALIAACAKPAETPEQASARMAAESGTARTAIEAQNARFVAFVNGKQPDSVAMLYTTDGNLMPPNAPMVTGRDSIAAAMRGMTAGGGTLALHTLAVVANGPLAVERGHFTFDMPAQGKTAAMHSEGKYIVHWHNVSGSWLLADDIWNDNPAPAPAAPAARH